MPLRQSARRAMAMVALLLLAACVPPPAETIAPPAASAEAQSYVIGPGDTLGIFVFRSPEFTTDVPVRPDGRISIPLVQDIQAAGRTPTELAREIERRLGQFVREPNVTVIVRSFVGPTNRLVRVIGEAAEPAALAYRDGMTLLDVMIATKGLTRFAAGNRATVVRREADGTQRTIPVRLSDLLRNGDISQDIPMRPGDTLVIPQSWF
jgi:polysaccharide biosynthesis/export protein